MEKNSVEYGSALLIAALKYHHPEIIDRLIKKNGDGRGNFQQHTRV